MSSSPRTTSSSVVVLSEWAAVAIDNARLYESVERRRAELERAVRGLEATSAIARAVGFETDLERVLELIVKRGRAMSDARSLLVLLQEGDVLRVAAAAGEVGSAPVGTEIPAEGSLAGTVLATGAGEVVRDLESRMGHGLERRRRGSTVRRGGAARVPRPGARGADRSRPPARRTRRSTATTSTC